MTNHERAEEIARKIFPIDPLHPEVGSDLRQAVSQALHEADADGYQRGYDEGSEQQMKMRIKDAKERDLEAKDGGGR